MLDISRKAKTLRTAVARAEVGLKRETIELVREGRSPKGDPLPVAKVAAIQAAKNTSQILPFCHPLPLDFVDCTFEFGDNVIAVETTVIAISKTGVEMEALTAASVAALTVYDMLKVVDETMEIRELKLMSKKGGKSDFRDTYDVPLRAAVLVMSDSVAAGTKKDTSGRTIVDRLEKEGFTVVKYTIVPDEPEAIQRELKRYADDLNADLILTTGGTGFSPRDFGPEATREVIERPIPGIPEILRSYGQERTPYSMLSRGIAGLRGQTLIVNLPGSRKGCAESLDALFPGLLHSFKMMRAGRHPDDERETAKPEMS
jgi:cyclic pyranopterin monophosphate synthase